VLAAGTAAAAAAAAARDALGAATPGAPTADAVAAGTAALLAAMEQLFRSRRRGFADSVRAAASAQMPGAPTARLDALVTQEMNYEVEYQRKARARLEADLPRVLSLPDAQQRAAATTQVLEREKRYLRQREQAAAQRVVGALEMDLIRAASPQGAYWQLSPLIREHCPVCLAMAGKFWPWEVYDLPGMHLPIHPNCGCRLLTLDEAVAAGLMHEDQVPDTEDAVARAKALVREANRLQETLAPEELERVVAELHAERIEEASHRQQLRFAKGFAKGGQFMPKRGGSAGGKAKGKTPLDTLRALVAHETPAQGRLSQRGTRVTLRGEEHFIPHDEHWRAKVAGTDYQSPAGGTNLYRDGVLMGADHPDFHLAGAPQPAGPREPGVPPGDKTYDEPVQVKPPVQGIPDYTGIDLERGKRAGGSTGAVFAKDASGDKWLVKTYGGDQDRIATELLANAVYRELGSSVAEAGTWGAPGIPDFASIPDADIGEPPLPKPKAKAKSFKPPKIGSGKTGIGGGPAPSLFGGGGGGQEPGGFGASRISTGIIVREADGSMWVYEPKGHFGGYEHTFPKGGLEKGLTPQQNAHKELWEETGLHARITGYVGDYEGDTGVSRYYVAVRTGGEPHADDPTPYVSGGSETAAVKRVTPAEAAKMLNRERDKAILKDVLAKGVPEEAAKPGPDTFPPAQVVPALTYPLLDGETHKITAPSRELGKDYMTHALVANWDFIGLTDDNVLWNGDKPTYIDQGGTFQFRAQGGAKTFGPVPTEVWTLNSPKGGQGFGKVIVSENQMRDQARRIGERLTDDRIDSLLDHAPFADTKMREEVRQNLKARVQWMRSFADGTEGLPEPLSGVTAQQNMKQWQGKLDPTPEEQSVVEDFVGDETYRKAVQAHLRSGKPAKDAAPEVQNAVKRLDTLLRATRTDDDMVVYKGIDPSAWGDDPQELVGAVMAEKGYLSGGFSMGEARSGGDATLQLMIPSGSRALSTGALDGLLDSLDDTDQTLDPDMQVLLARGTRVRVVGVEQRGGRTVVNGVVIPV
jgi:ADP-ribose pyrophosphatase YjhB (NUDIX family)